jgi:hypothetical protein
MEGKFGSPELMLTHLKKYLSTFSENILLNPDEWSFLFAKASIPNSTFFEFMTTTFYRQKQNFQIGNRVGEINLDHALSFAAGVVETEADTVLGA